VTRPISHRRPPAEQGPGRREGGYTLAMTAILLVPMMMLAALAVDVGSWYVKAQEIQRAADAAALAGVPFMPDFYDDAVDTARETAAKNGYTNGVNGVTVDVAPVAGNRRRLKVTITDPKVRTYFGVVVKNSISVQREAVAEYVLPVPLGSPRNYLGTGAQVVANGAYQPEYLFGAINGYCTSKYNGDQRASYYFQTLPSSGNAACSGPLNTEYEPTNYQYTIELPKTRTYSTDVIVYDGNYNAGSKALDQDGGAVGGNMKSTFTLFQPDNTPLDDYDNPEVAGTPPTDIPDVACTSTGAGHLGTKTFNPGTNDAGYDFNPGSSTFVDSPTADWWQLCRIPPSATGGRYILRVTNQGGAALETTDGTNNFGIVATPSSPQRICDARADTTCPKVYANQYLSVRAAAQGATANFFLSEIGPEHKGKKVVITLWDPAEGGKTIRIRRPTGTNTWTDQTFDWKATNGTSDTATTLIDVGANDFNGQLLTISFALPTTYAPPSDNNWWQIAYTFDSQKSVTDRTTWSVSIIGDPVHLVG
jgi:Putative Flp pilus-assembly TadE/G-like